LFSHWQLRTVLIETAGYEVEGEGGNFVCAFHSALDALRFGVRLQEELLRVPWDGELLIMKEARAEWDSEGEPLYKGLRVAVGMCSGSARRMQPSARTGKIEYYGPLMNHAARVAIFAKGGQVIPPSLPSSDCVCANILTEHVHC
jgi:adenylate cyclase